jgi:hypothetical protein
MPTNKTTSNPPFTPLDKLTYINVGANGTLTGKLHTTSQDIDAILAYVKQSGIEKIVLHFHGGLVSTEAGELTAAKMVPLYRDQAGSHPIVFIWETGFLETIEKNIWEINKTKLFQKVLAYVVQQAAKRLHIAIPGKGPMETEPIPEIEAKIRVPGGLQSYEEGARGGAMILQREELPIIQAEVEAEVDAQLESELVESSTLRTILLHEVPNTPLLDQKAVVDPNAPGGRGVISVTKLAIAIAKIVVRIVERYLDHRDHGFGPTALEESLRELYLADFGAWVWSGMKHVAETMWSSNDGLSGTSLHAGRYFLDGLAVAQAENPTLTIDLVGHSAGSIAICHLLKTAATCRSTLKIRNIIFMAPACTTELFLAEVVRHQERFSEFRMFTMDDRFECKNHLVEVVYERSLLYLISGILEPPNVDTPIAGMIRFDTGAPPFDCKDLNELRDFLFPNNAQRLALALTSVTAPLAPIGFRTNAARHQDFNTDPDTLGSVAAMIRPK